ncbi:14912_t:CDS:2, partial [Cetraspora pellucida]
DTKTTKFLETSNSAEVNQDMNTQTSCSTDNTSFNWANITKKELQGTDEHVSNQNSQSEDNNQGTDPLPQTTMTKILPSVPKL